MSLVSHTSVPCAHAWDPSELRKHLRGTYGPGIGWVVLADPEGNEFCILRSEAENAARDQS